MKARLDYIDVARGMAMGLVVLGHCYGSVGAPVNRFILSFHMPLFFFLSGLFCKCENIRSLHAFWGG